jgi:hypothetical protein
VRTIDLADIGLQQGINGVGGKVFLPERGSCQFRQ